MAENKKHDMTPDEFVGALKDPVRYALLSRLKQAEARLQAAGMQITTQNIPAGNLSRQQTFIMLVRVLIKPEKEVSHNELRNMRFQTQAIFRSIFDGSGQSDTITGEGVLSTVIYILDKTAL